MAMHGIHMVPTGGQGHMTVGIATTMETGVTTVITTLVGDTTGITTIIPLLTPQDPVNITGSTPQVSRPGVGLNTATIAT